MNLEPDAVLGFLTPYLLQIFLAAGTAALGFAAALFNKARGKVKNEALAALIDAIGGRALTAVGSVMEESVRHIKIAAEDGKLTPEEAAAAFSKAVSLTWTGLTQDVRKQLTKEAGSEEQAKKRYIETAVNKAVLETKTRFAETLNVPRDNVQPARLNRARSLLGVR